MMPDDTKKLREEIERLIDRWRESQYLVKAHRNTEENRIGTLGMVLLDQNRQTILAALRAVEQLPSTADGVPIVPGMKVWLVGHALGCSDLIADPEGDQRQVQGVCDDHVWVDSKCDAADCWESDGCYSAREAALASHPAPPAANCGEDGRGK